MASSPQSPGTRVVSSENNAAAIARAFATYALVPYLGILFCPGAVVMGSWGITRSYGARLGGRREAYSSVAAGVFLLVLQLFLWWILYKVPEWARAL